MTRRGMTERKRQLLDFVTAYIKRVGKSPTDAEIATHMACSRANATRMVAEMVEQGLIGKAAGRARRRLAATHA
jgi:DNA-binding MarR family transcriptional regulator